MKRALACLIVLAFLVSYMSVAAAETCEIWYVSGPTFVPDCYRCQIEGWSIGGVGIDLVTETTVWEANAYCMPIYPEGYIYEIHVYCDWYWPCHY